MLWRGIGMERVFLSDPGKMKVNAGAGLPTAQIKGVRRDIFGKILWEIIVVRNRI